jgi:hypothetical protein
MTELTTGLNNLEPPKDSTISAYAQEGLREYREEKANGITPEGIIQEAERLAARTTTEKGMFVVKPANQWLIEAKARPIPKKLFSELWYEGELCILFADTNLGKSILAVQIGNSITKGEAIKGFSLEAEKQKVLYFDFELSDKQFENRYSNNFENDYEFSDDFMRIEINPETDIPEGQLFEYYLNYSLEKSITETGAKALIIDNITYLKNETEKAKDALPLMKYLKALKNKYGLSILCLAHTPKRDLTKPITRNDLQGSKMLINFCDSSFAIGESSQDTNTRYIKQIKERFTEKIYHSENVCVCHITKPDNFLSFEFLNYGTEREHLKVISDSDREELENNIRKLLEERKGITSYAIAKELCKEESKFNSFKVKVSRIVKRISNK